MIYCDDYGILDTDYLVFASTLSPTSDEDDQDYLITLVLHVGHHGHATAICYPTRTLRDAAFEKIVALVQRRRLIEERDFLEGQDED